MEVYKSTSIESASYNQFFQDNYGTLQRWAIQITNDRELAEDLVHDVYLHFTRKNHRPANVESVEGYLYAALKNTYLSYLRRKTRADTRQLSLLDHEQVDNALLIVDPRDPLRVHEQLRAICHYACQRKSASISASILILRFFHGYFSAEVARIVKRSRNAVEARLHKARYEISDYLVNSVESKGKKSGLFGMRSTVAEVKSYSNILAELRETVFSAREGSCRSTRSLRRFYSVTSDKRGLERSDLSHLVSCPTCLDRVNEILRIPLLGERHPLDTRGPQITTIETSLDSRPMVSSAVAS